MPVIDLDNGTGISQDNPIPSYEVGTTKMVSVTPSDTVELDPPSVSLYVGVTGDVKITTSNGDDIVLKGMVAGVIHHGVRAKLVWSTGTTATDIVALY